MVGQLVDALFQENWDEDIIVGHLTGVSGDDSRFGKEKSMAIKIKGSRKTESEWRTRLKRDEQLMHCQRDCKARLGRGGGAFSYQ